jgi:hypothetical protein
MKNFDDIKRTFSNHRQWRDFIATIPESVSHPGAVTYPNAVRSRARMASVRCAWAGEVVSVGSECQALGV